MEASITTTTKCLYVEKLAGSDQSSRSIRTIPLKRLSDDFVRMKVEYSSLNYKDALCANGHPGVARKLPIIPGIDAAGIVVESLSKKFKSGDQVMVFHSTFGTEVDGGLSKLVDVPADWVYEVPENLSVRQSMILGTAGFTAAQCIDELQKHDLSPDSGEILVTGATGGVGVCAIKMLAKLGYRVVASTGKAEKASWLQSLGANDVIDRKALDDRSDRPLLGGKWAGAIDTVGGNTLAAILKTTKPKGCVTACGLVGGTDLATSVYPFILRGITLQGIDTAGISREYRAALWNRIASDWLVDGLEDLAIETNLVDLEEKILQILDGQIAGRVIVSMSDA